MLAIIDNYDSFTFNLYQMLEEISLCPVTVLRNDAVQLDELVDRKVKGLVLSPGPGHPQNDSDFGVCKEIILNQEKLNCPVLGVCLGHQGIVHHLGGQVVRAPEIVHGKPSKIQLVGASPLFASVPPVFEAMRYHSLVASEQGFPEELAVTAREANAGLIMACQHKIRPLYGVQFHPESICTSEGAKILENFVKLC